jgi:hypothetical protein
VSEVAWLTGFLDMTAETFEVGARFWAAATGTRLSPLRGDDGQFATLLPERADACWRVQQLDSGGPAVHLDLHGDMPSLERDLVARGATLVERYDDVVVLRSPGGLSFCVVAGGDETIRPAPVDWGTHTSLLDQVCLDVPVASVEQEVAFWTGALDTAASGSTRRPEFTNLRRPDHLPLRILVQRVGHAGAGTAHPDLATTDRGAEVARLAGLGAVVVEVEQFWTVLRAPDDRLFCVTERDPATGQLN